MSVHTATSVTANMLRSRSFVCGGAIDYQLTPTSLFEVLVSSIPILALAFFWTSRFLFDRRAALRDAAAIAAVFSIWHRKLLYYSISHALSESPVPGLLTASVVLMLITAVLQRGSLGEWFGMSQPIEKEPSQPDLPPLMIPCRTTHTRVFPAKHSFSYSYLFVGIPVGWTGRAGSILSADRQCGSVQGESRRTWFSVEADDYLERGTHSDGLRGKLFEYLRSQGVVPENYSRALLVTAPRFLGFSFNPVSFWYLYNETNLLEAMIVEVNNTFDERRMYFMERTADGAPASKEAMRHFHHSWEKDFHVSPFNSRNGSYSIQATDPYANANAGNVNIDCNIVLKTVDQKAKVVARVFSTDPVIDAKSMTRWQTLAFVFRWWWVGLMTNPRILREARILWIKKLQVYYRPEVIKTSIGRQESREEAQLEPCFRLLLERLVQRSQNGPFLSYIPAAGPRRSALETVGFPKSDPTNHTQPRIEIRVLTPAFYSQFVRFRDHKEAFNKLCFDASDSERHVFISDRVAFLELLAKIGQKDLDTAKAPFRWRILALLRVKTPICPALFPADTTCAIADDRRFCGLSQLDMLVLKSGNQVSRRRYCHTVTALLVADRFAFGWTHILRFYGLVIWAFLVYFAASSCEKLFSLTPAGRPDNAFIIMLGILGPHLWACESG
jgi:DUF1365 family protein